MTDTPEYKTLLQCNQTLRSALQEDIEAISGRLSAASLISDDLASDLTNKSRSSSERTARLVHFVTQRVSVDPSNYVIFIDSLRQDPGVYSRILQILSDTYSNVIGVPTSGSAISIDDLRQQHVRIMQLLDLSTILPLIHKRQIIPKEDYDRVADTKHHGSIERTGYLLHALYKRGQGAVDQFYQCLYQTKDETPRHSEILNLFEGGLPDLPTRSPLFEILDQNLGDIERFIEFTPFLKMLLESEVIPVVKFMDLQSGDRPIKENLERLIRALEEKGNEGFVSFMSCLRKEGASASHQQLFGLLSEKVKTFFKSHPKRGEVPQSIQIEILHMGARDQLQEKRVKEKFEKHRQQLEAKIQVSPLTPYLQKQHVLLSEESERLKEVDPEQRGHELLDLIAKKEPQVLVRFVSCLEASPENKQLAALFAPQPAGAAALPVLSGKLPQELEKHDKVAVIVQMEQYVRVTEDYQLEDKPFGPKIASIRGKLELNLRNLGFTSILHFKPSRDSDEEGEGQGSQELSMDTHGDGKPKSLKDRFREKVGEHCKDGAIVFIFVSGLQFPFEEKPKEKQTSRGLAMRGKFSAAILKDGASETSRRESECIRAKDLRMWAESLPNAHVTFLIDTQQSHVAQFGKQRTTKVAEIMDDPWGELISAHSTTVVYYLRADSTAMAHQLGVTRETKEELGLLTDCFVSTLLNCYKRTDSELSHRQIYEALSLYWHRRGRQHLLFVPAIQGDMDREFLGKSVIPYHQFFRADMPEPNTGPDQKLYDFNLSQLQIATGSMSGLIMNDRVEVFHVLRPSVRADGRVMKANQLDCTVEVVEGKDRDKLKETIDAIYQDEELRSKDGSTECLCVVKKYPLHRRFSVFTEGLSTNDAETIKFYVKAKSLLLSVATKRQEAELLVEQNGNYLIVKDLKGHVKLEPKARDAQHVKIFLEMMAWYKHIVRLLSSSPTRPPGSEQRCHLNAEKALLSSAPPLCDDLRFKWSSYTRASEDRLCHSAILSYSQPLKFWSPMENDTNPCLEVEFKKNHVITTIELRGDSQEEKYVKRADIWFQRDVYQEEVKWQREKQITRTIDLSLLEEAVRFVTIVPQQLDSNFNLTFKIWKRLMSPEGKKSVVNIENLTVINWRFHKDRGTGWKCIPVPDDNGAISLETASGWLNWSGSTGDPITFDIGFRGAPLDKIEFTTLSEKQRLHRFLLRMQTDWMKEEKTLSMMSAWPTKHEFQHPLVVSNLQVWPRETNVIPSQLAGKAGPGLLKDVKLQMQLYGNEQDTPLEVEEGHILAFHFSNITLRDLYVYIFCLEETGNIKFVTWDIALHHHRTPLKKLLQAYIPEGYDSSLLQIKDQYKVLVSTRKMYLEPLIQRGLHDYRRVCSYNVCSLGRRGDFGPEPWFQHSFEVIVKKSPRRQ